jgi:hypothetical protein
MAVKLRRIAYLAGQLLAFQEELFSMKVFVSTSESEVFDVCYSALSLHVTNPDIGIRHEDLSFLTDVVSNNGFKLSRK